MICNVKCLFGRMASKMQAWFLRKTGKLLTVFVLILLIFFALQYHIVVNRSSNVILQITSPVIEPEVGREAMFLLILVTSKPSSFTRRELFRRTMGTLENSPNSSWTMVFNLGSGTASDVDVEKEAAKYRDVLVGNFKDTYDNLVLKTFTAFRWAAKNVKSEFVLKADDDVYVHFPRLIAWLRLENSSTSLYAGALAVGTHVERSPWKLYFISYKTYAGIEKGALFHTYCRGPFYVLSHNLLGDIWTASKAHEAFAIEDAYVGILLNSIGIKPRKLPKCEWNVSSFVKLQAQDDSFYRDAICVGHMFGNTHISYAHLRFKHNQSMALSEWWKKKISQTRTPLHQVMY